MQVQCQRRTVYHTAARLGRNWRAYSKPASTTPSSIALTGDCNNDPVGPDPRRLVWDDAGLPFHHEPCGAPGFESGRVAKCELFEHTGEKRASNYSENVCYAKIRHLGATWWIKDRTLVRLRDRHVWQRQLPK